MAAGFRRRILIVPAPGRVVAELEDDYHRMTVALDHAGGVVTAATGDMTRWPWTTCRGAIARLAATFTGVPLSAVARRGEKALNCTHLHDLALFAAAHVRDAAPTTYELWVGDPVDGLRRARLSRDHMPILDWTLRGDMFLAPEALASRSLGELNPVIAELDSAGAEAVRMLRWACILALGRAMDIPAGLSATAFPLGSCHTFQPDQAAVATRRPDAAIDFSAAGVAPLADRAGFF